MIWYVQCVPYMYIPDYIMTCFPSTKKNPWCPNSYLPLNSPSIHPHRHRYTRRRNAVTFSSRRSNRNVPCSPQRWRWARSSGRSWRPTRALAMRCTPVPTRLRIHVDTSKVKCPYIDVDICWWTGYQQLSKLLLLVFFFKIQSESRAWKSKGCFFCKMRTSSKR